MPFRVFRSRANPIRVHNFAAATIPPFVTAFLAKGSRFVPDLAAPKSIHLLTAVPTLERSLNVVAYFSSLECRNHDVFDDNKQYNHNDNYSYSYDGYWSSLFERKKQKCSISGWKPPADPRVDCYIRLLRRQFETYKPYKKMSNLSFMDKQALAWLKKNNNIAKIADTDKNLGDAIFDTSWIQSQIQHWLEKSFVQQSEAEFLLQQNNAKHQFVDLLYPKRAYTPVEERNLLLGNLVHRSEGHFRIRPKIHKPTLSSRPVMNLRSSWIQQPSSWCCAYLQQVQAQCSSVIVSSEHFIERLNAVAFKDGDDYDEWILACLDIKELYPSVVIAHMIDIVTIKITQRALFPYPFCQFLADIIALILNNQQLPHNQKFFVAVCGLATGLSMGVS